jgi:hypothetical protein
MLPPGGPFNQLPRSSFLVPRSTDYLLPETGAPLAMTTKLDKTLKREIDIDGQPYTVTISPEGVKLTQKGFRKGREMSWRSLWQGGTEEGSGGVSG